MIKFDSKIWKVHDPDNVISFKRDDFNELIFQEEKGSIKPREDLIYFSNEEKKVTIDFGFYRNEANLEGEWISYVIDNSLENHWERSIEKFMSQSFFDGLNIVEKLLKKYS